MAERHIFAQKVASWASPSPKSRAGWRKPRLPSDGTSSGLWVQWEAGLDVKGWAAFEKRPCLNQGSDPLSARVGDIALLVPYCLSPLCLPTSAGHCWGHTDLGLQRECGASLGTWAGFWCTWGPWGLPAQPCLALSLLFLGLGLTFFFFVTDRETLFNIF